MTLFWVIAALLMGLALAFLITPLVRNRGASDGSASRAAANLAAFREQLVELDADLAAGSIDREQWELARGDLQRGLLEAVDVPSASAAAPVKSSKVAAPVKRSKATALAVAVAPVKRSKATAIVVAVAVPLVSVSLYLLLGNRQGLEPAKEIAAQGAPHELTPEQINAMVARLAQKLATNPDNGEGWVMLARSYNALGRFGEAAAAYAKAEAKYPQDSQFLADYADSLAMAQGQSLQGKPEALIRRALQADGNNLKALALAGTAEFERSR